MEKDYFGLAHWDTANNKVRCISCLEEMSLIRLVSLTFGGNFSSLLYSSSDLGGSHQRAPETGLGFRVRVYIQREVLPSGSSPAD